MFWVCWLVLPSSWLFSNNLHLRALTALATLLVLALLFQNLGLFLLNHFRTQTTPRRFFSYIGACLGVFTTLFYIWLASLLLFVAPYTLLGQSLQNSYIVNELSNHLPSSLSYLIPYQTILSESSVPLATLNLNSPGFSPLPIPSQTSLDSSKLNGVSLSIVQIFSYGCEEPDSGSGIVVGPDTILTAAHVVAGSQSLQVLPPNSTHNKTATLVYFNPQIDIALLHVQGLNITPLKPATSTPARGELVAEIGYPNGGKGQILPGRIRASFEAVGFSLFTAKA